MTPDELTPVENIDGMFVKRDDLFSPFGINGPNGGKLRQCWKLVEMNIRYDKLITCCSIHSPQAPITAAVAKHFNKQCDIYYGGTTFEKIRHLEMPKIVQHFGGNIHIYPSGRHNILYSYAKKNADENTFIIEYGFNLDSFPEAICGAVANQVENIPDVENLVVTCGSGITASGIITGIHKFGKKIKNLYLFSTAPSRQKRIDRVVKDLGISLNIFIEEGFQKKGFQYEKEEFAKLGDIVLHPNYEAKTYNWLCGTDVDRYNNKTLFWIVGSKPSLEESVV